jgi:hypothetical protein
MIQHMEHYIPPAVFNELQEWAADKAPLRVPDQPKFGKQPHTLELKTVNGSLVAMCVLVESKELIDVLRLS